jgi:hypothetical protein
MFRREKSLAAAANRTPDLLDRRIVTIMLPQILPLVKEK